MEPVNRKTIKNVNDYNVPVDMSVVRARLAQKKNGTVTARPLVVATKKPQLRFQPSSKPFRPWDNKDDRLTGTYSQVGWCINNVV